MTIQKLINQFEESQLKNHLGVHWAMCLVIDSSQYDQVELGQRTRHYFQEIREGPDKKLKKDKVYAAIHLQRHLRSRIDEKTLNKISAYFDRIVVRPNHELHLDHVALSKEESIYLKWLYENARVQSPQQIHVINPLLDSFSSQEIDFSTAETIITICSEIENEDHLRYLSNLLLNKNVEERKRALFNLQVICSSQKADSRMSNADESMYKYMLERFFNLNDAQQEEFLGDTEFALRVASDKEDVRITVFENCAFFPDQKISECFDNLEKLLESNTMYEYTFKLFQEISPSERTMLVQFMHSYSELDWRSIGDPNILKSLRLLLQIPSELVQESADYLFRLIQLLVNDPIDPAMEKIIEDRPHWMDVLAFVKLFISLVSDDRSDASKELLMLPVRLTHERLKEITRFLTPHCQEIKSALQFRNIIQALDLFPNREQAAIIPQLIKLLDPLQEDPLTPGLKKFPAEDRADILRDAAPYLEQMVSYDQKLEFIISIGFHRVFKSHQMGTPEVVASVRGPTPPPLVSADHLERGDYSVGLIQLLARYFGAENNPTALQAASQWIQRSARQIFVKQTLFLREITANALDVQLSEAQQTGNFGVGFYSIFALFFQTENPIDRIEIQSRYGEDAYLMTITKDEQNELHVTWSKMEKIPQGTEIRVFPKQGTQFSDSFLKELKDVLQEFRFFRHGHIVVNEQEIIGNAQAKVSVGLTLTDDLISVRDPVGIPLKNIHFLLIPSISSKRPPGHRNVQALDTPNLRLDRATSSFSSLIFTINGVVNSSYRLSENFVDAGQRPYDLLVEMPNTFKPNLSRDGIIIPDRRSLQADAICRMVNQTILNEFSQRNNLSPVLQMLYCGLKEWESKGLSSHLQGFFSETFQMILRNELSRRPECLPCMDHGWVVRFNNALFQGAANNYIPLPRGLIPEGYLGFELAVIEKYKQSHPSPIVQAGANRRLIEGLAVLFIDDELLRADQKLLVTCGPFTTILFAPLSLLAEANHDPTAVQRLLCQRFTGRGKLIAAADEHEPSPLFSTVIHLPGMKSHPPNKADGEKEEKTRFDRYLACVDLYLNSPILQSLDKEACITSFWKFFPDLKTSISLTQPFQDIPSTVLNTPWRFFENVRNVCAFRQLYPNTMDDCWTRQAIFIDPVEKKAYRINRQKNIQDLIDAISEVNKRSRLIGNNSVIIKNADGTDGEPIWEELQKEHSVCFEEVSQEELFKRLCVLLFVDWELDPGQPDNVRCFINGIEGTLDFEILEAGVKTVVLRPDKMDSGSIPLFSGSTSIIPVHLNLSQKIAPFHPILSNLEFLLSPQGIRAIVKNLADICFVQKACPAYCHTHFEQLLELYYQYFTIHANDFPYKYGSSTTLRVNIVKPQYLIADVVEILQKLSPELGRKLLQGIVGKFTFDLGKQERAKSLNNKCLNMSTLSDNMTLRELVSLYHHQNRNIDLISLIIDLTDSSGELTALALVLVRAFEEHPAFFSTSLEHQKDALEIILNTILRKNSEEIAQLMLSNGNSIVCIGCLQPAIDSIELFTGRYQLKSLVDPALFQNPSHLFNHEDMTIFTFEQLMEAFFHVGESLAPELDHDLTSFTELVRNSPSTGRFRDFGMLTNSTSQRLSYESWQGPFLELLTNSIEAIRERPPSNSDDATRLTINYTVIPCNALESHFALEIAEENDGGFKDLKSLAALLVPGYHPDSSKMGLGLFRALTDVEVIHYQTTLQNNSQVVSLLIEPVRNTSGQIVELRIGLRKLDAAAARGTVCRVYLRPQKHIYGHIRMKRANKMFPDTFKKIRCGLYRTISASINGSERSTLKYSTKILSANELHPESPPIFGSIRLKGGVLIDGFPHSRDLNELLVANGLLHPSCESTLKLYDAFINFPKSCFVPLQDPNQIVFDPQALPWVKQFVLDWLYQRIFLEKKANFLYSERKKHFLKNLEDSGHFDQLIFAPDWNMGSTEQIHKKLTETGDYSWFYIHYSMTATIERGEDRSQETIRMPSFSEYLLQAYEEVVPQWVEIKNQGATPSFDLMKEWKRKKCEVFNAIAGATLLANLNKKLLGWVVRWYKPKFQAFVDERENPVIVVQSTQPVSQVPVITEVADHPIMSDPKWQPAITVVEESLTFYAQEMLRLQNIDSPEVTVKLCGDGSFVGCYIYATKTIQINLKFRPLSAILFLLESMERKVVNAHFITNLLHTRDASRAGLLDHEVMHALMHVQGRADHGHDDYKDMHYEAFARELSDGARSKGILTGLEKKIHALLEENDWSADSLKEWIEECKRIEEAFSKKAE